MAKKKQNRIVIDLDNKEIVVPSAEVKNRLEGKGGFEPLSLEDLYHISTFKVVRKLNTPNKRGDTTTLEDIKKKVKSSNNNELISKLDEMINDDNINFFTIKKWYKENFIKKENK